MLDPASDIRVVIQREGVADATLTTVGTIAYEDWSKGAGISLRLTSESLQSAIGGAENVIGESSVSIIAEEDLPEVIEAALADTVIVPTAPNTTDPSELPQDPNADIDP